VSRAFVILFQPAHTAFPTACSIHSVSPSLEHLGASILDAYLPSPPSLSLALGIVRKTLRSLGQLPDSLNGDILGQPKATASHIVSEVDSASQCSTRRRAVTAQTFRMGADVLTAHRPNQRD